MIDPRLCALVGKSATPARRRCLSAKLKDFYCRGRLKKMKANFSTTDLIYCPGDFLPSINVISAICDNTRCGSRSAQRSWLTDGLTGVCA
jgi:hypothetical protein